MVLSEERRNAIAWRYVIHHVLSTGKHWVNFDSAEVRQSIRTMAEVLEISFEEAMAFAEAAIEAARVKETGNDA